MPSYTTICRTTAHIYRGRLPIYVGPIPLRPLDVRACVLHRQPESSAGAIIVNSLSAHPCFKTLDPESCRILDRHCIWLTTAAGAWVVGQTAHDRDVYFVVIGRLRAALHGFRQDLVFTDIEAGSFFGELSALEGAPRSPSVFAVDDSTVARMPSAVFVETMFTHRPLGEAVVATLVARNRTMTRKVGEAAHIYASRSPHVGPTQPRPLESRFDAAADIRHTGANYRLARRWS